MAPTLGQFTPSRIVSFYTLLFEADPKDGFSVRGRGIARAYKGDYDESLKDLSRGLELEVGGWAYFERGCVHTSKHSWPEALSDFRKARELLPEEIRARSPSNTSSRQVVKDSRPDSAISG